MHLRTLAFGRAESTPERAAYTFLAPSGDIADLLTYEQLDRRASALAFELARRTEPGARVLLAFEPGLDFVIALFACIYSARVAVPIAPPRLRGAAVERLQTAWGNSGAELVLSHAVALGRPAWADGGIPAARCLDVASLGEEGRRFRETVASSDVAFLQYTSGSTSTPKGVAVSHSALLDNLRHIQRRFGHSERTKGVSWLPASHDMGLVGCVLEPLHSGFCATLMSPIDFVQRPLRWLTAIERYGAETSGGPTFGYRLCVERITSEQVATLDLSRWRVAFVGAEPVRSETLTAFARKFAPAGFRAASFTPCYGMAEATLMISAPIEPDRPRVINADPDELERGRLVLREDGRALVSCGEVIDGHRLQIVDPNTRRVLPDGEVGEIWLSGPSVARGYWGDAERTQETFHARLDADHGVYLRSGDLGVRLEGQLYLTGRLKTQIIYCGRNIAPEDLERAAQQSCSDLQPHGGAAFSLQTEVVERIVMVHEVRRESLRTVDTDQVRRVVQEAVAVGFGAQLQLVLVLPGSIPRTTSGKVQRFKTRDLFLAGRLTALAPSQRSEASDASLIESRSP